MTARVTGHETLITSRTLMEYFHDSVDGALSNQSIAAEPDTIYYLVNLLSFFSRSENLYERTLEGRQIKPLALMYADALNEPSPDARCKALRRLGDVSLFVSGVFSDSLQRKVVDLDYYAAMGEGAYGSLSGQSHGTLLEEAFCQVFAELAGKFRDFVDVLSEVSERGDFSTNPDMKRLYETWSRTGSKRARRLLVDAGVHPIETARGRHHH